MTTIDPRSLTDSIAQMRALIQDCRERVLRLRPAWEAHLVEGTLRRLCRELDALEQGGILEPSEHKTGERQTGEPAGAGTVAPAHMPRRSR